MELALRTPLPPAEHASYYSAVIKAPYFPVEVTPRTQQSYLKRKDWKVDHAVQSCDKKIQKHRRL